MAKSSTATKAKGTGPHEKSLKILERFTTTSQGSRRQVVKLSGVGVPTDCEVYLFQDTFDTLQLRPKSVDQSEDWHEYDVEPERIKQGKGGVYEFQCSRCSHSFQAKMQPAFGLDNFLPPFQQEQTAEQLSILLEAAIWPFLALFYILYAFHGDATRTRVPLAEGFPDSSKHIDWILSDTSGMIDKLCERCPMLRRSYGQPPALTLDQPQLPKHRGILQKVLLEVKMLIVASIVDIKDIGLRVMGPQHHALFEQLMVHIYEDCCAGGVDQQYMCTEVTNLELKKFICGGGPLVNGFADAFSSGFVAEDGSAHETDEVRMLREALRHLSLGRESLDRADALSNTGFEAERTTVRELAAQLQAKLDQCVDEIAPKPPDSDMTAAAEAERSGSEAKRQRTSEHPAL